MPFVFGIFGVLLIVAGVRKTTAQLFTLIKSDFTGQPNYFEWMIAIFLVGAVGYVQDLQRISRMFMFLLVLGLLWQKRQVFASFVSQDTGASGMIIAGSVAPTVAPQATPQATQQTSSTPVTNLFVNDITLGGGVAF